ncbi:MAG: ABC transporter substrate-binding protein, partial [Nitrososphaerales archaeon]
MRTGQLSSAISKIVALVIVVVLVVIAVAGAVVLANNTQSTQTTTTLASQVSSTSSFSSSITSATGLSSSSASVSSSGLVSSTASSTNSVSTRSTVSSSTTPVSETNTLTIDSGYWPGGDLNQLTGFEILPWPDWSAYTAYQTLVDVNVSALYNQGIVQYLPGLAVNWTVSANGTDYTFNLRHVNFSNGDPFNAYQVWTQMYGFYYLSANSSGWFDSYLIFNMSNVNFGASSMEVLNSSGLLSPSQQALAMMQNSSWPIYVSSPYQITFRLDAPFQWFLGTFLGFGALLFDSQYVLDHGGFGTPGQINAQFNQQPIPGTGPYVFNSMSENSYVQFSQNPTYWGRNLSQAAIAADPILDPGHVKNVIINYKPDDLARYADLSTGQAQIAAIRSENWNLVLANSNKYSYLTLPTTAGLISAIGINTQLYPTNITDVRQAIVHAINYSEIAQKVFFGHSAPWVGPEYPAWKQFYDLGNYTPYAYNITLAQQYLSKANISNIPTLTYRAISGCDYCVNIGEILQSDLAQIGINVNIQVLTGGQYFQAYLNYPSELQNASALGHLSLLGGYEYAPNELTPADYWVSFVSNESFSGNWAIYYNSVVQKAINTFFTTTNTTYIQSLVAQAQTQIYNDAPYAWLGINTLWLISGSLVWDKTV